MKKVWKKPELTVLTRGTTAERVLGDCKTQRAHGPGDTGNIPGCMNVTGGGACRGRDKAS
jgi:hypothetical protein